jgi:uncharacterized protein YndB with AHSA1/START domain
LQIMNHVERDIVVHAPRSKVWRAITTLSSFGSWFEVAFDGAEETFRVGATVRGAITSQGHEGLPFEAVATVVEPEHTLAFRWPHLPQPDEDAGPVWTTVTFTLTERGATTHVAVREEGFDALPASRRRTDAERNGEGWGIQVERIKRFVEG